MREGSGVDPARKSSPSVWTKTGTKVDKKGCTGHGGQNRTLPKLGGYYEAYPGVLIPKSGILSKDIVCASAVISFVVDVRVVDASAGVTQEEGHTVLLHIPSAVLVLIFIARSIQPSLSLVDREVEFCVPTYKSFSPCWAQNPSSCDCTEIRTHVPTSDSFEATN